MGSFIYRAYKALREEKAAGLGAPTLEPDEIEEAVSR
jgi:hypothetical protein